MINMTKDEDEIDISFAIIDEEDVEVFLGKKKITKEDREDVEKVGDFEV